MTFNKEYSWIITIASERSQSFILHYSFCRFLSLSLPCTACMSSSPSLSPSYHHLTPPELPGISLGRPGSFCPASDLHEQVCQLVWHHAPGPFSDEAGPGPVQRPGVHTEEEVQGHREAITLQSPPAPWTQQRESEGAGTQRRAFPWLHGWISGEANRIGHRGRGGKETWTDVEDHIHWSPQLSSSFSTSHPSSDVHWEITERRGLALTSTN